MEPTRETAEHIPSGRRRALEWYFDFLNDDLDSMTTLTLTRRVLEAPGHFLGLIPLMDIVPEEYETELTRRVTAVSRSFPEEHSHRDTLKNIQGDLRALLGTVFARYEDQRDRGAFIFVEEPIGVAEMSLTLTGDSSQAFFRIRLDPGDDYSGMRLAAKRTFCDLLSDVPVQAIRRCQECRSYFLHFSARPRYYCNPKCTSRALSRKRRKADPEGYRAKQRETMRRVYRERQAKKQSVSPDKVKIQKKFPPKGRKEVDDGKKR